MGPASAGAAWGLLRVNLPVVGLTAVGAMGARAATVLAAATSAEVDGPPDGTAGYHSVAFTG